MGALSPLHLVIVLVIALLVIGPGKLPETGAALGRAIREFRHSVSGDLEEATPPIPGGPLAPEGAVEPTPPPSDGS